MRKPRRWMPGLCATIVGHTVVYILSCVLLYLTNCAPREPISHEGPSSYTSHQQWPLLASSQTTKAYYTNCALHSIYVLAIFAQQTAD